MEEKNSDGLPRRDHEGGFHNSKEFLLTGFAFYPEGGISIQQTGRKGLLEELKPHRIHPADVLCLHELN